MDLKVGDWVELSDGRTAQVSSWDTERGVARAELPTGGQVERPIAFAVARWRSVPEDGLRVRLALDPEDLRRRAKTSPADLVAFVLADFGGEADTRAIRMALSPGIVPAEDFERWWKRVQPRLDDDERLDTSRAREKKYRLRRPGEAAYLRPPRQSEKRRGRYLADGPQLKRARERASHRAPHSDDDEQLFRVELTLANDGGVDPTDRFMAAELAIWLERQTPAEAIGQLGDDIFAVDLLRIPQGASRSAALDWALERSSAAPGSGTTGSYPIFQSALALGKPWSERVLDAVGDNPAAARDACEGILGWAIPGTEDAGPAKYPDDLQAFDRRIERAEQFAGILGQDGLLGLWRGTLRALEELPGSSTHAVPWLRLLGRLAALAWVVYHRLDGPRRPRLAELPATRPDGVAALLRAGNASDLKALRPAVLTWYRGEPARYATSVRLLASLSGEDELRLGLDAARHELARTAVGQIAAQLIGWVKETARSDPLAAESVSLAGTAAADSPFVSTEMERLAEVAATGFLEGTGVQTGSITFSPSGWERFGRLIARRLDEAATREQSALREATEATEEVAKLRQVAETRSTALVEARSTAGSAARSDASKLASNLLRPVALAVADSFEGDSLEALQDRLLAVLQRAKINPILEVGEQAAFDPIRHQWVGEGNPEEVVRAVSPGFVARVEGEEDVVLVPARVVALRT